MRIVVRNGKFTKEQDESSKKQFTEFLFLTFGMGLNKNMVLDRGDLRIRRVQTLKALSSDQMFEAYVMNFMREDRDSRYLNLGIQCIDFKRSPNTEAMKKLLLDQLKDELFVGAKNRA